MYQVTMQVKYVDGFTTEVKFITASIQAGKEYIKEEYTDDREVLSVSDINMEYIGTVFVLGDDQ